MKPAAIRDLDLKARPLLQADARIIQQLAVHHGYLVFAQTENPWDNALIILLLREDFQLLDRIGIEFHTCADDLQDFKIQSEDSCSFSFLGHWELEVLRTPRTLKFRSHPLGPIIFGGTASWWDTLLGRTRKPNAFLLLRGPKAHATRPGRAERRP